MSANQTPGTTISSRYRLDRLLGEGGMGAVWAATHLVTQKPVALKFLKSANANQATIKRFLREARAVSAVQHPNVVQVHDVLDHDGHPVMVMDLLLGESLAARLARSGSLTLPEFARIMLPVVSAIGCAHAAGIVHRDIKPDNIFLREQPDGEPEPTVLDFGIAKLAAPEGAAAATAHLTSTGAVMGTPYYMAPEQVFGEKDLDHRADVWAVGVLCYECLSGKKPFDGDNVGQLFKAVVTGQLIPLETVAPHLPKDVTDAITRLLKNDKNERAPDLKELYAILERYSTVEAQSFGSARSPVLPKDAITGDPHGSTAASLAGTIHLPLERRRLASVIAGGVVLVAGLGIWFFALQKPPSSPEPAASVTESPVASETPPIATPSAPVAVVPVAASADSGPAPTKTPRVTTPRVKPSEETKPVPPPATPASRAPGTIVEPPPF